MATATNDVDDIRRQMAQIRRDMHVDMQAVVAGAEAATSWRYYVKHYPWAALGVAFAVGFLIVPRRRSVSRAAEAAAEQAAEAVASKVKRVTVEVPKITTGKAVEKEKTKWSIWGALFGMIVPVAMKAAQNYASHFVESWIVQQQAAQGPAPAPAQTPNPSRPQIPPRPF